MFNSRQYEYADITLQFGGVDLVTLRGVKFKKKVEREAVYGKGRQPLSIQSGNESFEGDFQILKSDYDALEDAAGGNVLDIRTDILVSFGNPSTGDTLRTKKLIGVAITEVEQAMKQGDKFMEITMPFIALGEKKQ